MKKVILLNLLLTSSVLAFAFSTVNAQGGPPPGGQNDFGPPPNRPNIFQELGLTKDQLLQLRRINIESRPNVQASKQRQDDANKALDEAIYGDNFSETEIQTRLKDAQTAHAEFIKYRTLQETAVRRILTPAQLVRFRQLRQQFDEQKRQMNNRPPPDGQPMQNPNRLRTNIPRKKILQQQPQRFN